MSKNLPVPLRSARSRRPDALTPEVIVLDAGRDPHRSAPHPLARLAIGLAPDVLRAVERSLAQRGESAAPLTRIDSRKRTSGFQLSEVEYDLTLPFVRKVTVRKASAWAADLPHLLDPAPTPAARTGGLRRAGIVGAGAVALAAIGLLANRIGGLSGLGGRR